jgi:aryl-alcohol dehydrogenase-like predicted oxidoreductase
MTLGQLVQTALRLSASGLGLWIFGGTRGQNNLPPQDDRDSIANIKRALEYGINCIDTAPTCGLYHAEEVVGKVIKNTQIKPYIATKYETPISKDNNVRLSQKGESIRSELEQNLKRLVVEIINLFKSLGHIPIENWKKVGKQVVFRNM